VKHHVGTKAANTLINNRRAEYGINILNAMYHSEWALERPLDIVAMTVYLKGFAALKSETGILWVLRRVLAGDMLIDRPFLATLKDACKNFGISVSVVRRTGTRYDPKGFVAKLKKGRQQCIERRHQQRHQTKVMGNLLVKRIIDCVEFQGRPTVNVENRVELEEAFFGQGEERELQEGEVEMLNSQAQERGIESRPSRLEVRRAKARLARAIRFQGEDRTGTRRTRQQTLNVEWVKQYRAFIRQDLIMADGKLASFRRYVG
jgi:hypothetical protein